MAKVNQFEHSFYAQAMSCPYISTGLWRQGRCIDIYTMSDIYDLSGCWLLGYKNFWYPFFTSDTFQALSEANTICNYVETPYQLIQEWYDIGTL